MATFANETTLRQTADFFKILGDPTRVKLLLLLSQNEYCVSELAEQIVVIDHGKVVEEGNHESLTAERGAYYNLVKNQLELGN